LDNDGHVEDAGRRILAAAAKVFDACGYAQTRMEAVAVEAGVSKGSIYNYFRNKQDLFMQVSGQELANYRADVTRVLDESVSAAQKLTRLLDDWFDRLGRLRRMGRLMLECWATAAREQADGGLSETFSKIYEGWCDLVALIVAQGIEEGQFAWRFDPRIAATLIVAMGDGITVRSILDERMEVDQELLAAMKRAILSGLARPVSEGGLTDAGTTKDER